jgi:DNA polymerase-3 subunit alpha
MSYEPIVHLHAHTIYSELDGIASPQQYADECAKRGYPAMAITEHGHMGSVPDMYLACQKAGIKYIAGCEIYYNDWEPKRQELIAQGVKIRSQQWRDDNPEEAGRMFRNRHLTVLCKNQTGFENLVKLTTQAYETGLFGLGRRQFNRIWFEKLCEYKEGLIVLSGCLNGPAAYEMRTAEVTKRDGTVVRERSRKERYEAAIKYFKKFKQVFGDDYYVELQMPGVEGDDEVFRNSIRLANELKIKTCVSNDCHYMKREDFILQKIMMAIAQETTVDSPNLFHVNSDEQYFKSREELEERFSANSYSKGIPLDDFRAAADGTLEVADKCQVIKFDSVPKIPDLGNTDDKLRGMVFSRLRELGLDKISKKFLIDGKMVTYTEQAELECNRFIDKGFASYFIITQDLVNFGKNQGFLYNPRGSAGGSLVCFLLGIHVLDPMKWGLSFDRFLSPSRGGYLLNIKMPEAS